MILLSGTPPKPIGPHLFEREGRLPFPSPQKRRPRDIGGWWPPPLQITIVEKREIKKTDGHGFHGHLLWRRGASPVIREERSFCGVDAVIDKDLASAKLAEEVGVDIFLMATDVEGAALRYGRKDQAFLRTLTVKEAQQRQKQGHFPPGSMGPKVEGRRSIC